MSNKKAVGLVFANANDELVPQLTQDRAIASVPFGGRYRLIDFVLSNMARSGIFEIGVITRKNYYSLMEHIGSGREWDLARKSAGIHILPPHSHDDYGVYSGRAQALGNALEFLEDSTANYVVLTDCDKIVNMSLKPVISAHIESGADITMVYKKCYVDENLTSAATVLSIDADNNVLDQLVNPNLTGEMAVSLNIIITGRQFLIALIKDALSRGYTAFTGALRQKIGQYSIKGYEYTGETKLIRSIKSYYDANMSLLDPTVMQGLFPVDRPVFTRVRDEVPAKYGLESLVKNSLVSDGCIIEGEVENCVLSRGVHVKKGAVVKNSILMQGTVIGQKANVNFAIADRGVEISDYRVLSGTEAYPVFVPKNTVV